MGKVYKEEKLLEDEEKYPQDIIRKHCLQKLEGSDFLGGPVIKMLSSQYRGPGFQFRSENQIPHVAAKTSHAASKAPPCCNEDLPCGS